MIPNLLRFRIEKIMTDQTFEQYRISTLTLVQGKKTHLKHNKVELGFEPLL